MKIEITGEPKEIAALVLAVQERQSQEQEQEQQHQIFCQFERDPAPVSDKAPDNEFMLKRDGVELQRYMGSEIGNILHLMDLAEGELKKKFLAAISIAGIALAISLIILATS